MFDRYAVLDSGLSVVPRPISPTFRRIARVGAATFLVPQLSTLLWWLRTSSAIHFRGWINAEYLLLLSIAVLFPSRGLIALLTAELTVSLIEPIAHLYYFSPEDTISSLRYLLLIPFPRLTTYIGLLVIYIIGCYAMLRFTLGNRRRSHARPVAALLLLGALLPSTLDLLAGRSFMLHAKPLFGEVDIRHEPIARAPVASLVRRIFSGYSYAGAPPDQPLSSALSQALAQLSPTSHPNVVLVLTESWGLGKEDRLNEVQIEPYRSPAIDRLYRIQTGTAPFVGGTTSGETRELCGDSRGRTTLPLPPGYYQGCWPARLANAGYHTQSVHGFTPTMFSRKDWYRQFGFQQSAFLPELEHDGAAVCDGAFPGVCDADVAQWIGRRLMDNRDQHPTFVHWVTLNSHLPIPPLDKTTSLEACRSVGIDQDRSFCSWFMHVLVVQNSVANLALTPGLPPTVFVIVGDHAPPFLNSSIRERFSQTSVPYVVLMPKTVLTSRSPQLAKATPRSLPNRIPRASSTCLASSLATSRTSSGTPTGCSPPSARWPAIGTAAHRIP